jgi:UDPglucose 6-dehydrogenase
MASGATVVAHDPEAMPNVRATPVGQRLTYATGPYAAAKGADALVVATEWPSYRELDLKRVAWLLQRPVLLDLRGIYSPQDAARAGLDYHCVGAAPVLGASQGPVAVEHVIEPAEETPERTHAAPR